MKLRKILHMDMDAFFCSVEELRDPSLKGKAFAVGGPAGSRGVISTASYAARKFGVHSALPTAQALKLCPGLILISSFHSDYEEKSRMVMNIVGDFSPLVETLSIDEAFIDISDLSETPLQVARTLQSRINREALLPCSIGGATNMLVAKIANDFGKHLHKEPSPPNAITIVEPGDEAKFIAPLPIGDLWGVGPKTEDRLKNLGITTIGDLATRDMDEMASLFGQSGRDLVERARGIDFREIQTDHEAKSVSQETTFDKDTADRDVLLRTIRRLAAHVGSQLRKQEISAKTVRIKIRWANFETHTRQVTLNRPTDCDSIITTAAIDLFEKIWTNGKQVRLIGVGTSQFNREPVQLNLLETGNDKEKRLLKSVDELRERFGKQILMHGFDLKESGEDRDIS